MLTVLCHVNLCSQTTEGLATSAYTMQWQPRSDVSSYPRDNSPVLRFSHQSVQHVVLGVLSVALKIGQPSSSRMTSRTAIPCESLTAMARREAWMGSGVLVRWRKEGGFGFPQHFSRIFDLIGLTFLGTLLLRRLERAYQDSCAKASLSLLTAARICSAMLAS